MILHQLQKQNEQIIDLEKIAHHKGSSFGSLGEEPQPSQEQFENELASHFSKIDATKKVWVENESRRIGTTVIPPGFWEQMKNALVVSIDLPTEERVNYLVSEYGKFSKEELITATTRIGKKLGGQHVKRAIQAIEEGDLKTAFEICLVYYDKTYTYGEENREKEKVVHCDFEKMNVEQIAIAIKKICR